MISDKALSLQAVDDMIRNLKIAREALDSLPASEDEHDPLTPFWRENAVAFLMCYHSTTSAKNAVVSLCKIRAEEQKKALEQIPVTN